MKKESLIGKKVKGFKFEEINDTRWTVDMENYVNQNGVISAVYEADDECTITFKDDWFFYPLSEVKKQFNNHPLIITKQTKVRAGKKYFTFQFSKNKKVSNHQYNSSATRNKQLAQFIEDIKSGNYEIK